MTECRVISDSDGDVYTVGLPCCPSITSPSDYIICLWDWWDIPARPHDGPSAVAYCSNHSPRCCYLHCEAIVKRQRPRPQLPSPSIFLLLSFCPSVSPTLYVIIQHNCLERVRSKVTASLALWPPREQTLISRLTEAVKCKCGQSYKALIVCLT